MQWELIQISDPDDEESTRISVSCKINAKTNQTTTMKSLSEIEKEEPMVVSQASQEVTVKNSSTDNKLTTLIEEILESDDSNNEIVAIQMNDDKSLFLNKHQAYPKNSVENECDVMPSSTHSILMDECSSIENFILLQIIASEFNLNLDDTDSSECDESYGNELKTTETSFINNVSPQSSDKETFIRCKRPKLDVMDSFDEGAKKRKTCTNLLNNETHDISSVFTAIQSIEKQNAEIQRKMAETLEAFLKFSRVNTQFEANNFPEKIVSDPNSFSRTQCDWDLPKPQFEVTSDSNCSTSSHLFIEDKEKTTNKSESDVIPCELDSSSVNHEPKIVRKTKIKSSISDRLTKPEQRRSSSRINRCFTASIDDIQSPDDSNLQLTDFAEKRSNDDDRIGLHDKWCKYSIYSIYTDKSLDINEVMVKIKENFSKIRKQRKRPFVCKIDHKCGKFFGSKLTVVDHIFSLFFMIECPNCKKKFNRIPAFYMHLKMCHKKTQSGDTDAGDLEESSCDPLTEDNQYLDVSPVVEILRLPDFMIHSNLPASSLGQCYRILEKSVLNNTTNDHSLPLDELQNSTNVSMEEDESVYINTKSKSLPKSRRASKQKGKIFKYKNIKYQIIEKNSGQPVDQNRRKKVFESGYIEVSPKFFKCLAHKKCNYKTNLKGNIWNHIFSVYFYLLCLNCSAKLNSNTSLTAHSKCKRKLHTSGRTN